MLVDFVMIFGIVIILLLILFLLNFKNEFSKRLLILFFVNSLFFILYYYAYNHKIRWLGAVSVFFANGVGFVSGPFLFFYVKSLILPKEKVIKLLLRHLIPFYVIWLTISLPLSISIVSQHFSNFKIVYNQGLADIVNIIENLYYFVYMLLTLGLVSKIQKNNKNVYSSFENDLTWFVVLVYGILLIVLLDTLYSVYELFYPMIVWNIGNLTAITMIILYCILGYRGLFQSKILIQNLNNQESKDTWLNIGKKQENKDTIVSFSKEELIELDKNLHILMKEKRVYTNPSLNLRDLAIEMNLSNKQLTNYINAYLNTNFHNLINNYRIEEFKKRIVLDENYKYTILTIALDCGFNSKSSFNRVFKANEGITPTQYLKTITNSIMG